VLTSDAAIGASLKVSAYYEGRLVGEGSATVASASTMLNISLAEKHLWECGNGRRYDLEFSLTKDGKTDLMSGYFGLREVALSKEKGFQLNGKTVYGRFVLDQGYFPTVFTQPPRTTRSCLTSRLP